MKKLFFTGLMTLALSATAEPLTDAGEIVAKANAAAYYAGAAAGGPGRPR